MNAVPYFLDGNRHPMLKQNRPLIDTKSVERVANAIVAAVEDGNHGLDFNGNARFGKTQSVVRLAQTTDWRRGMNYTFFHMQMTDHDRPSEAYFFGTCVQEAGLKHVDQSIANKGMYQLAKSPVRVSRPRMRRSGHSVCQ